LPWIKKEWQLEQETNIAYVAATRAKETLVIVNGEALAIDDDA
jgi:superfamily I DNA/RNA helicase